MQRTTARGLRGAALAALLLGPVSQAAAAQHGKKAGGAGLDAVKRQLAEQRAMIDALRRELDQRAQRDGLQAVDADELALRRGTGNPDAPPAAAPPGASPQAATAAEAASGTSAQAARAGATQGAVGQPPRGTSRPPEVAPLFDQPGVLTAPGKYVLEPSFQFGYSSSNRVALVGYTVIPALLIGLVDVREVRRNTLTGALAFRTGLSNRFEVEMRVPYVYRSDSAVSRELFTGSSADRVFDTSGKALGDVELAARYQLNKGAAGAYYVAGLRVKSRTGRDPFNVVTDCIKRCVGDNVTGTGLPLDLPTGSGFYSLQPSLTWLFSSDPAVFFGSIGYLHNFKRKDVSRLVLGGEREFLGDIKPGDIAGFNFGMGLALNEKASLSLGYDHSTIGRTRQAGIPAPGSVRTQLGTLLIGYSYRVSDRYTVNVSVGAGLTRDTPDVSLSLRVPLTF
ncbi:MAG: acetate kinase [Massilia sp.]